LAIPAVLIYYIRKRRDVPFQNIFWLFGLFIFACGATHLMGFLVSLWPAYRLDGLVKLITAVASWGTVAALFTVVPRALSMRTPEELEKEIEERRKVEDRLVHLNEVLEERSKQLEAANTELIGFTYSVSHDLRTPLRGIVGYSQILVQDAQNVLDEESLLRLRRLETNALKMAQLIENLLDFSRVGQITLNITEVDLTAMAEAVGKELQSEKVLVNLIENAWKYVKPGVPPKVVVGQTAEGVFYVRDEGIGFDMKYESKIWEPFERLHVAEDYKGTGIGLANVRRIIVRHKGRIWAESAPGAGSTFYFELPSSEAP
jgi:light-regulated signal transduction histidine kinase (bacteriophytochrome)